MRWCLQKILKKLHKVLGKKNPYDTLRKGVKYRGNTEATKIIDALEVISKKWKNKLPTSFYIMDCNEKTLNQILNDLGYHNPIIKRKPRGRNLFSIMIRPKGS